MGFHKNSLDIYCDYLNKELSHLDANRLFTIGSVSCLDIRPCHYLSPSWKFEKNEEKSDNFLDKSNKKNESMLYLENIIKQQNNVKNNQQMPSQIHPNLFLNASQENELEKEGDDEGKDLKTKRSPSQLLMGSNYNNKKKQFLKLYDRKMQRIARKNSQICDAQKQSEKATEPQQISTNNIWESFIMKRQKNEISVHKETKKAKHSQTTQQQQQTNNENKKINKQKKRESVGFLQKVRFRECSDKAREKNLSRCLLGRFRGFAESVLFSILSNRTLVILANDVEQNKEKVMKT